MAEESGVSGLIGDCQIDTKLYRSLKAMDDLASQSFDAYIRVHVRILSKTDTISDIRAGAANEIGRQLSSPLKSFAKKQIQKWHDLSTTTKTYVETALMNVLGNLQASDLVDSVVNMMTTIAATSNKFSEDILKQIKKESSMHTIRASFIILGNVVNSVQGGVIFSASDDLLLSALELGLSEPENYVQGDFNNMQLATLTFFTNLVTEYIVKITGWRRTSNKMCFLKQIGQIIMDKEVLLSTDKVCDAAINLMVGIISFQQRLIQKQQSTAKADWDQLLSDGLHTQLVAIGTEAMTKKAASKSVKMFFEKFHKFF